MVKRLKKSGEGKAVAVAIALGVALPLSILFATNADAQVIPARPLAVKNLEGSAGPGATLELREALARSNQFQFVPAPTGVPEVSGKIESGLLVARLDGPDGRTLLSQKYKQGDLVQDVRQFADDVVLALTKKPGIATSQIAFSLNRNGQPQVFLCDFDGDNVRQMTEKGINDGPALSPDGALLAHFAVGPGNQGTLIVTDLESGKSTSINRDPAFGIRAVFSPDGKRLAISMSEDAGPPDLYLSKVSGMGRKPEAILETPAAEMSPSWSPDGKRLVFAAATTPGLSQIYQIDPDKKKPTPAPIPTGYPNGSEPAWSPDGTRIAFVTFVNNRSQICIHPLGGTGAVRIAEGHSPVWGADSRHLIFTNGGTLTMIDSATGRATVLVSGSGKITGLSWTR